MPGRQRHKRGEHVEVVGVELAEPMPIKGIGGDAFDKADLIGRMLGMPHMQYGEGWGIPIQSIPELISHQNSVAPKHAAFTLADKGEYAEGAKKPSAAPVLGLFFDSQKDRNQKVILSCGDLYMSDTQTDMPADHLLMRNISAIRAHSKTIAESAGATFVDRIVPGMMEHEVNRKVWGAFQRAYFEVAGMFKGDAEEAEFGCHKVSVGAAVPQEEFVTSAKSFMATDGPKVWPGDRDAIALKWAKRLRELGMLSGGSHPKHSPRTN